MRNYGKEIFEVLDREENGADYGASLTGFIPTIITLAVGMVVLSQIAKQLRD